MDLSALPIVDHHAHPLLRPEETAAAAGFRRWFTESLDPEIHRRHVPNSLFFRVSLRWLAEFLGCRPTVEAVLEARAAQPYETWVRRLFGEARIETVLCDYGYQGERAYSRSEMQALLPCPVRPILRLESLAERLIAGQETFEKMTEAFAAEVASAGAAGYTALKSIAAYRSGLDVAQTERGEAAAAFVPVKEEARRAGRVRLASKPLVDYLLWLALEEAEEGMPLQFHTGFGDRDADLRRANPLHLRGLIERTERPVVLLHAGWPYYREAAHLAALYSHVWLDLSLAIPFATTGIPAMLYDVLGMAPLSKVLFATDAFTMPEIYWLACRWGRWGLGQVMDRLVEEGFLEAAEAWGEAEAILAGNARGLYGLR